MKRERKKAASSKNSFAPDKTFRFVLSMQASIKKKTRIRPTFPGIYIYTEYQSFCHNKVGLCHCVDEEQVVGLKVL